MESLNILFVLYGGLSSCSGVQVSHFAAALAERGHRCHIASPDIPAAAERDALARIAVGSSGFREAGAGLFSFPGGGGPDIIHGWTPRENVRRLCTALAGKFPASSLAVHLEDHEGIILAKLLHLPEALLRRLPAFLLDLVVPDRLTNPRHFQPFVAGAGGVSVIVEKLLELVPTGRTRALLRPVVDLDHFFPRRRDGELRRSLGVGDDESLLAFTGSVHHVNAAEARTLYRAVALANTRGLPCRLLRTGMDHCTFLRGRDRDAARFVVDLGFLPYEEISRHLSACDILVQPGSPGPFNDFRLPSKVPEYLAMGRPVALPATNLGLLLRDRQEAMLLRRGDEEELVAVIAELRADDALARRLGEAGRAFAEKHFHKDGIVRDLEVFYHELRTRSRSL